MRKENSTRYSFNKGYKLLCDHDDSMVTLDGKTDVFSTGTDYVDRFIGGGYGKQGDFEIVLVFGEVKQGKSTFALNMLTGPIRAGKVVGMFIAEDSYATVKSKMRKIVGDEYIENNPKILTHIQEQMNMWTLDNLSEAIGEWFDKCDVILVDHLQAFFESAVLKGNDKYDGHKRFLLSLRNVMHSNPNKAIILISHVSKKQPGITGSNRIQGSHGLREYATKILEVSSSQTDDGRVNHLTMWESRHNNADNFGETLDIYFDYPKLVSQYEWQLASKRNKLKIT